VTEQQALQPLSEARRLLAEAETVDAALDVAKMAKVAEALAREADLGLAAQNDAVLVRAEAYAKAADFCDADPDRGQGRKRSQTTTLSRDSVLQWRDGREALRAGWHETLDPDHELTWAQFHKHGNKIRLGTADQPDDYYTPPWLFDALGVTFDLDVAAPEAGRTVPAHTYYTETDDGLNQPWHGLVWCNPPYSAPEAWAHRFTDHGNGIWLSLLRNGQWLIPLLDAATTTRIWVQPKFVTSRGGTMTPPGAHALLGMGAGADVLAAADLGAKVSQPL